MPVRAATVAALRAVRADVCVLGVCSFHSDVGVSALDADEADVKRAMIARVGEVIALATAHNRRTASTWVGGGLVEIDHLVTDDDDELTRPHTTACINVVAA